MRLIAEHVKAGTIGDVREVHVWTNRPIWPQGMEMPTILKRKPTLLDWDLYLGPAPEMAYDPAFHPFTWRGWVPFGTGALGDIAAHRMAFPFTALDLDAPATVETRSTAFNGISYPVASTSRYEFPARAGRPPVRVLWYDGGLLPPRPDGLPEDEVLGPNGMMYTGSEATLIYQDDVLRFLPDELDKDRPEVPRLFERIAGESHEMNWIRAIRGEEEGDVPLLVRRPADGDGAAGRRLAPSGQPQAPLGRGEPPRNQPARGQRVPAPRAAQGMGAAHGAGTDRQRISTALAILHDKTRKAMTKGILSSIVFLAFIIGTGPAQAQVPAIALTHPDTSGEGWEDLFASDLSNALDPAGVWTVEDGLLTASEDEAIFSKKEYDDYILDLEVRTAPDANSGVILHASNTEEWIPNSLEIQIGDKL